MIYQFLALLVVHWIADFVLQTHWQASNKSKNNWALAGHVLAYTMVLTVASPIIFFPVWWVPAAEFIIVNGILHFATDWCTSRVTSRLFMKQFQIITMNGPGVSEGPHLIGNSNFTLHNFFIVVGLDQLIHHITLGLTMVYFFGAR